jgi:hypothetical protein
MSDEAAADDVDDEIAVAGGFSVLFVISLKLVLVLLDDQLSLNLPDESNMSDEP